MHKDKKKSIIKLTTFLFNHQNGESVQSILVVFFLDTPDTNPNK